MLRWLGRRKRKWLVMLTIVGIGGQGCRHRVVVGAPATKWRVGEVLAVPDPLSEERFWILKVISLDRESGCALLYERQYDGLPADVRDRGPWTMRISAADLLSKGSIRDVRPRELAMEPVTDEEAKQCTSAISEKASLAEARLLEGCTGHDAATGLDFGADGRPVSLPPDFELKLERTACFGTCPVYTLTIDAQGRVTFTGVEHVRVIGSASDAVSRENLLDLAAAACHARLFERPDVYDDPCPDGNATDMESIVVTLVVNGHVKRVEYLLGCLGNPATYDIKVLALLIDDRTHSERWVRTSAAHERK